MRGALCPRGGGTLPHVTLCGSDTWIMGNIKRKVCAQIVGLDDLMLGKVKGSNEIDVIKEI